MSSAGGRIGLLGLGNRSTQFYIDQLNRRYRAIHGGYATFPFVMLNVDFNRINPFLPDDSGRLDEVLLGMLTELQAFGVGRLLIPNISLHAVVDRVIGRLDAPLRLVHPVDCAAAALLAAGHRSATVLGTRHSMRPSALWRAFDRHGIELRPPQPATQDHADALRTLIADDADAAAASAEFLRMLASEVSKPALLACTELSIAVPDPVDADVFDMARLQVASVFNDASSDAAG